MTLNNLLTIVLLVALTASCAKPKDGTPGTAGGPGPGGSSGAAGPAGPTGADATPVTAVKFCSAAVTVYPTSFPEFGFCISGKLYATYWDGHNAWTAEVVPGYYASTSTSAPCSFTVSAGCTVN